MSDGFSKSARNIREAKEAAEEARVNRPRLDEAFPGRYPQNRTAPTAYHNLKPKES